MPSFSLWYIPAIVIVVAVLWLVIRPKKPEAPPYDRYKAMDKWGGEK